MHKLKKSLSILFPIAITAFIYFNCTDNTVTQNDNLDFSYIGSPDSVGDNTGILTLDTIKLLLKDIKLNVASTGDSNNFKTGPYVVFFIVSTTGTVNIAATGYIPPGTYDKVKFEIHKLEDNETPPDPEFADAQGRYSVIAKGTYLGDRFVYKSTKSAKQQIQCTNNLFVTSEGKTNITLMVKPYIWFINQSTGAYMDPRDPNNANDIDNNIKDNIKHNLKCFKDNDRNGIPD
jgi:hypothetical protein